MRNDIIKYGLYGIVLLLAQVLVLNNIQLSGYLNPNAYILLILILPFETPGWLLLLIAFAMGLSVDVFPQGWVGAGSAIGFHASASLLIAFLRPTILRWINPRDEYEPGILPGATDLGFRWYGLYALLMTSIHHFALFLLESFNLAHFSIFFLRFLQSTAFTLLILLIFEGFRYKQNK